MNGFIILFAVTWLLSTVSAQVLLDGPCSRFMATDVIPFFRKPFMGNWYLYGAYDYKQIIGLDCITFFYEKTADGNAHATERGKNLATNTVTTLNSINVFDRPGAGHYLYQVPAEGSSEPITIIATDYVRYFVEFACVDSSGKADCYVGIMTRLPFPDPVTIVKINRILDRHHIDKSHIRYIVHDVSKCTF